MMGLIKLNILARLKPQRWIAVFVLQVLMVAVHISDIRYEGSSESAPPMNVWDVLLCVFFDTWLPGIVFPLAFVLITGDDLISAHADGTLQSTWLRERSILRWWLAKIVAWGALAISYVALFMVATTFASLLRSVPVELGASMASAEGAESFSTWYLLPPDGSPMAYSLVVACYTAVVLWVLFAVYMALSLFAFPSLFISYACFFLAFSASTWLPGDDSMFAVGFFLSPAKHLDGLMHAPVSPQSFALTLAMLMTFAVVVGYVRLRRLEI
jgi:hypothetical protein